MESDNFKAVKPSEHYFEVARNIVSNLLPEYNALPEKKHAAVMYVWRTIACARLDEPGKVNGN